MFPQIYMAAGGLAALLTAGIVIIRRFIRAEGLFGTVRWATRQDLRGKYIIVTGANAGLGLETVRGLAEMGADVALACRSGERAKIAVDSILATSPTVSPAQLSFLQLDLGDFDSIASFTKNVKSSGCIVDVLICNAGVVGPSNQLTVSKLPMTMGTNHIGHFHLVISLLADNLIHPSSGRIVVLSSDLIEMGRWNAEDIFNKGTAYNGFTGGSRTYCNSKLYNSMFVRKLQARLLSQGSKITAFAVNPGYCWSDLDSNATGLTYHLARGIRRAIAKPTALGAQTAIHCASSPEVLKATGLFYSNCAVRVVKNKAPYDEALVQQLWDETEREIAAVTSGSG